MTLSAPRSTKRPGYLLMEAMVAAAILAVGASTVISQIAHARVDLTRAAFRDAAIGLAHAKLSELEADVSRATFAFTTPTTPGTTYPNFYWRWRVSNANTIETNTLCEGGNPLTQDLFLMEAEVTYPVRHATADDMADGLADGVATVRVSRVVR